MDQRAIEVKICGVNTRAALDAALAAGADRVGFVLFAKSPRAVSLAHMAQLAEATAAQTLRTALVVDPEPAELDALLARVALDAVQFHGGESPDQIAAIRARLPASVRLVKALGVASSADLDAAQAYGAADEVLFDAKPAPGADRPGGWGRAFDWRLMADRRFEKPWMLAGGLTPETVAEAVRVSGAQAVDVSSGVEDAPGVKSAAKMEAFVAAARAAAPAPGV